MKSVLFPISWHTLWCFVCRHHVAIIEIFYSLSYCPGFVDGHLNPWNDVFCNIELQKTQPSWSVRIISLIMMALFSSLLCSHLSFFHFPPPYSLLCWRFWWVSKCLDMKHLSVFPKSHLIESCIWGVTWLAPYDANFSFFKEGGVEMEIIWSKTTTKMIIAIRQLSWIFHVNYMIIELLVVCVYSCPT